MTGKRLVQILAWLAIATSSVVIYASVFGWPLRTDFRPHRGIGERVAVEALKLLGPGGRLMVINRDTRTFKNPAVDAQLKRFHQVVKKAGVTVASTNLIQVDPLRPAVVPAGELFPLLKKSSSNDVAVCFLGPPLLTDQQIAALGAARARIVALCAGISSEEVSRLFARKSLDVAVVSRKDLPKTPPLSSDPAAWFDYLYAFQRIEDSGLRSETK